MFFWMTLAMGIASYYRFISQLGFWLLMVLTFILTSFFNMYLTSLPIVVYNTTIKSGIYLGTIPIEDFVFAALMLTNLMVVTHAFLPKKISLQS
jgi:lycopene cyclase domain-containing protein